MFLVANNAWKLGILAFSTFFVSILFGLSTIRESIPSPLIVNVKLMHLPPKKSSGVQYSDWQVCHSTPLLFSAAFLSLTSVPTHLSRNGLHRRCARRLLRNSTTRKQLEAGSRVSLKARSDEIEQCPESRAEHYPPEDIQIFPSRLGIPIFPVCNSCMMLYNTPSLIQTAGAGGKGSSPPPPSLRPQTPTRITLAILTSNVSLRMGISTV